MAYYNGKKVLSVVQSGTQLYRHELEVLDQSNFDYYVILISTDGTSLYGAQTFDIEKVVTAFYIGEGGSEYICIQSLLKKNNNGVVTIHMPTENNDYYDFNSIIADDVTQIL